MFKIIIQTLTVLGILLSYSFAQVYYEDYQNHTYENIETVTNGFAPDGYMLTTTNSHPSGVWGIRMVRTDMNGGIFWERTIMSSPASVYRVTDVETVDMGGNTYFLLTGAVENVSSSSAVLRTFLMLVDDNGNLVASNTYQFAGYMHSITLHAAQVQPSGGFVAVGMLSDGSSIGHNKDAFFMQVDATLALTHLEVFESSPCPAPVVDYDMADHIEVITGNEFFITGMQCECKSGVTKPIAMAKKIETFGGGIVNTLWDSSFDSYPLTSGAEEAGASAYFDGATIWVLSNNSINKTFDIRGLDPFSGAITHNAEFTIPGSDTHYGFELMPSNSGNELVVAGWSNEASGSGDVYPFLLQYSPSLSTIQWDSKFPGATAAYATSAMLDPIMHPFVGKNVPYYTPDVGTYRLDPWGAPGSINGYVVVNPMFTSTYLPELTPSDMAGNSTASCGFYPAGLSVSASGATISSQTSLAGSSYIPFSITHYAGSGMAISNMASCGTGMLKPTSTETELSKGEAVVYPNPTTGVFTYKFENISTNTVTIELMDATARSLNVLYTGTPAQEELTFDINEYPSGVYMLKIQNGDVTTHQMIQLK